ncbi:hypothetical protein ACCO45_002802 [Purpureocillium lilacinum]|uniref:Uncharacterized protein n=1 Tax=Purpureocillium lilacinum TaxID=33203 RepID=A0ACC4DY62_PURLI
MDLLISLPLLSYFLSPHVASWSTSINIIFFYMTWTTLIITHPPVNVHIAGILVIRVIFWLVPSVLTLAFDSALPSLAASLKHGGWASLPPRNSRFIAQQFAIAVANLVISTAFEGLAAKAYLGFFGRTDIKTSTTLPMPMTVFTHLVILYVAREVIVYYTHRYVLHQQSYGGTNMSIVFEWLAGPHRNWAHCLGTVTMSGYIAIPGFLMNGIAQRMAVHYASGGGANFGACGVLDWINETGGGAHILEEIAQ